MNEEYDTQALIELIVGKRIESVSVNSDDGTIQGFILEGGVHLIPSALPIIHVRLEGEDPTAQLDETPPADNIVPYRRKT